MNFFFTTPSPKLRFSFPCPDTVAELVPRFRPGCPRLDWAIVQSRSS